MPIYHVEQGARWRVMVEADTPLAALQKCFALCEPEDPDVGRCGFLCTEEAENLMYATARHFGVASIRVSLDCANPEHFPRLGPRTAVVYDDKEAVLEVDNTKGLS